MRDASQQPPDDLSRALRQILRNPVRTLVPPWSWKAATLSAVLRAATFFVTNLRSGRWQATKALLVEAVFAIWAGGLIGAISQQLRRAKPLWATALLVWAGLPSVMILAQFMLHRLAGTPHLGTGLAATLCLASIASAFSWYAMRQGILLGGSEETSIVEDIKSLPRVLLSFVLVVPRMLASKIR